MIIWWFIVWALLGAVVGNCRGCALSGACLGIALGPIGILLILLWRDERPKCRECLGVVPSGAVRCCHCGVSLPKQYSDAERQRQWRKETAKAKAEVKARRTQQRGEQKAVARFKSKMEAFNA